MQDVCAGDLLDGNFRAPGGERGEKDVTRKGKEMSGILTREVTGVFAEAANGVLGFLEQEAAVRGV